LQRIVVAANIYPPGPSLSNPDQYPADILCILESMCTIFV
jgi:hypothetical protein